MMAYFLQLSGYTLLFYSVYALLLKKQPYAQLSRVFLWLTIVLPFVLPFLKFSWPQAVAKLAPAPLMQYLPEVVFQAGGQTTGFNGTALMILFYAAIALFLLFKSAGQWWRFRQLLQRAEKMTFEGVQIALLPLHGPGSFGRFIFFPDKGINPEIFRHELAHVQQRHDADLMLLRFLRAVCWPHFLLHFLEKELRLVHEYAADRAAVGHHSESYVQLLLAQAFGVNHPFIHTFFHHPLKQRIVMLQQEIKTKTGRRLRLKSGLSIALLSTIIVFAQCQKGEDKATLNSLPPTTVQAYKIVDDMPEFKGDVSEYLGRNLRYPEAARDQNKEGRVIIQFIVDKDGKVRDAKVVKSSGTSALDEEGLRVVRAMPEWEPGRQGSVAVPVYFTLPIQFVLTDANHEMSDGTIEK